MRRLENIALITVFPNDACLQQVLHLVAAQLKKLQQGIPVLDLKNSLDESKVDAKDRERFVRASDGLHIPFKQVVCRCAYSAGDSVNQVDVGGGRSVNSTYFCSRCYTNKPSAEYRSTVHKHKAEILNYDISKFFLFVRSGLQSGCPDSIRTWNRPLSYI